ncbi:MAG: leucine--tRNA ligase, partial [Saccharolobus sp.]
YYLELLRDAIKSNGQFKKFTEIHKPKNKEEAKLFQKIFNASLEINESMKKLVMDYNINEISILNDVVKYIKKKLNVEVEINEFSEEVRKTYNKEALPLRPVIIIE